MDVDPSEAAWRPSGSFLMSVCVESHKNVACIHCALRDLMLMLVLAQESHEYSSYYSPAAGQNSKCLQDTVKEIT